MLELKLNHVSNRGPRLAMVVVLDIRCPKIPGILFTNMGYFIQPWISNHIHHKCGMKLLDHYQISTV